MFALAVAACLLVSVALASADMFVSTINPDELNKMGVHRKP